MRILTSAPWEARGSLASAAENPAVPAEIDAAVATSPAHARFTGTVPRFYFHLLDDVDAPDKEGVELADLGAAVAHAVRQARFTAAETLREEGKVTLHHRIDVEDEGGQVLHTVHFGDVVKVER